MVRNVEGAADISVEKVVGLPQVAVRYNRDKIAQHGLKLRELNRVVRYELLYQFNKLEQITYLDSLYSSFAHAANRRYEVGETDYPEKLNAEARYNELNTQKKQVMAVLENPEYVRLQQSYLEVKGSWII